jgi:anti-anti-sigma factor
MKLNLLSIEKDGVIRVGSEGQITAVDLPSDGRNPMESVMGANWAGNRVLLDLSKTNYIDSSAVGWLINCSKQFKAGGGTLVIHSMPGAVRQILDLLKIGKLIPLAANEPAARELLGGLLKGAA